MNKCKQTITKQQQKVITTAKKNKPKYKKKMLKFMFKSRHNWLRQNIKWY